MKESRLKLSLFLIGIVLSAFKTVTVFAQGGGGAAGLESANQQIRGFYEPASNLILAVGAIVGLIGGVRCYIKWNTGDQDVMKSVMGWGGACVFLVIVGVVIKAFFSV